MVAENPRPGWGICLRQTRKSFLGLYVHKYKTGVKREEKGKQGAVKTSHIRKGRDSGR